MIEEISRADRRRPLELARRCGSSAGLGIKLSPRRLVDLLLRIGPKGDLFGLRRGGLSLDEAGATTRTGSSSPSTWRPAVLREAGPPPRQAGPPRPAGDPSPRRIGSRRATATTRTSRCG